MKQCWIKYRKIQKIPLKISVHCGTLIVFKYLSKQVYQIPGEVEELEGEMKLEPPLPELNEEEREYQRMINKPNNTLSVDWREVKEEGEDSWISAERIPHAIQYYKSDWISICISCPYCNSGHIKNYQLMYPTWRSWRRPDDCPSGRAAWAPSRQPGPRGPAPAPGSRWWFSRSRSPDHLPSNQQMKLTSLNHIPV